jgi:hypothetical protein
MNTEKFNQAIEIHLDTINNNVVVRRKSTIVG